MSNVASGRKQALVTGGTGAIGKAIVAGLVNAGFAVTIPVRDLQKGQAVATTIAHTTGSAPRIAYCDLSLKESISALKDAINGPLHLLVNNAAECPRQRQESEEGVEKQLATNVLGYVRMIDAFTPALAAARPSRIVNVASYWAGGLDLDDLEFRKRRYDNDAAYRQSKQADRMLSAAFAGRLKSAGITVNACHPGDVRSKLSSDLGFGGYESPADGADTPLFLALDDIGGRVTGRYFAHRREDVCRFSADREGVEALFEICKSYG